MSVYLDNAASSAISPEALDCFKEMASLHYANPEAGHVAGREVKAALERAAAGLLAALALPPATGLCWTSCATEALNLAARLFEGQRGNLVVSACEHPALSEPLKALKGTFELRRVKVLNSGKLDMDSLASALDSSTLLVGLHHVQSETGVAQDLPAVGALVKERSPRAKLLADTSQSLCKLPLPWQEARLDLAVVAGHKIGAPLGGALLFREDKQGSLGARLGALRKAQHLFGRPDPAAALALARTVELNQASSESRGRLVAELNAALRLGLEFMKMPPAAKPRFNAAAADCSPYIVSFRVPPYQGAILARMLGEAGVMVSAGSACEAESGKPSQALLAMGVSPKDSYCSLRVSFWERNTLADVEAFLAALRSKLADY